jgi:hypothetical protein
MSETTEIEEEEGGKTNEWRNNRPGDINYSSRKPWWLVVLIILGLLAFGIYIKKINTTESAQKEGFWAFLTSNNENFNVLSDSLTTVMDTSETWEGINSGPIPNEVFPDTITVVDEWGTPPINQSNGPEVLDNPKDASPDPNPLESVKATGETTYYIIAGEFEDKLTANKRMQEIRQGNYPAKIIEPTGQNAMYRVVAGEYKNQTAAQSKAEALGFILEIKTRVEKKEN